MFIRRSWLPGSTVVAALMAGFYALTPAHDASADIVLKLGESTCILSCEWCGGMAECNGGSCTSIDFGHVAPRVGDTNEYGGGYHDTTCFSGSCEEKHPECEYAVMAAAEAEDALRNHDAAQLAAVADRYTKGARIERGALQLLDCDGNVVAHIPLSMAD